MKKSDWSIPAIIAEALDILILIAYLALQICYGVIYSVSIYQVIMNIAAAGLVYAVLTLLAMYPHWVNRITKETCKGRIRVYTLRMLRIFKLIFLVGLLIPCICDVVAVTIPSIYNACLILLLVAVAVYYEVRILLYMRSM
ncbi:MAG: hypothetical protein LIO37_04460 [Clostridiales bacterium]|nr:hypothetical protein [Clostridiales bacterium]